MSRVLSWTVIYLVCTLPRSSSHATRARCGPHHSAPIRVCSGWGLPSRRVAATLVVSYTTVSAFPFTGIGPESPKPRRWESSFLRHFPSGRPAWPLASILPSGARTFLTYAPAVKANASRATVWPTSQGVIVARSRYGRRNKPSVTTSRSPVYRPPVVRRW